MHCQNPLLRFIVTVTILASTCSTGMSQELVDAWRFTQKQPAGDWQKVDFDESKWRNGDGGFGTRQTPGARVNTVWQTNNIWLRKTFVLDTIPKNPALLIHHDEDAQVFVNGTQIASLPGFSNDYKVVPIEPAKRSTFIVGKNVIAVHCQQSTGGQFIDAHVVDADNVPKLPAAKRITKPFSSELITTWGADVTAENAWTEYPRPLLQREQWQNLNGNWDYAVAPDSQSEAPKEWAGKILVPFCLESKLGGVGRLLDESESLWYRRTFTAKKASGERQFLNFEAVDYLCEVFVNGVSVGHHQGGNVPFSIEVTDAIKNGENELVVRVEDDTERFQLRGKQTLDARGIWYTQVSGIWQTVWLETVSSSYIKDVKITSDFDAGTITVRAIVDGDGKSRVVVRDGNKVVSEGSGDGAIVLKIAEPKYWSPESPYLYDLELTLRSSDGAVVDRAKSYAAIRSVGKVKDNDGNLRFTLNGKPIFHWGPLDQGWWPDGLLTPPSDEAMLFDIEWLKSAGFNMIRKHIKVEPRRYYFHCDRLGMMVWQDQVSGGPNPAWTRLVADPKDATWPDDQHAQFMKEFEEMVWTLEDHPSIVVWTPFNEAWGQHRTMKVGKWMVDRDPTRIVNIASGGNFWPVGDVVDAHAYPNPSFPFDQGNDGRFNGFVKVMGEFGGHGLPVQGHLWDASRDNWGYGGLPKNESEYKERYLTSLKALNDLRRQGIAAGVYTQTTDVEGEINGLITYDRKVIKIPAEELAELHKVLFEPLRESDAKAATGDQFSKEAFIQKKSNRKPGPVMDANTIRAGLKSHDRALFIKSGWIRDPYITLGPDNYYYLTGTQPNPSDARETKDPYDLGLGDQSLVGEYVLAWRSKDLVAWESLGEVFSFDDSVRAQAVATKKGETQKNRFIWAPEVHWLGNRWALVHCPRNVASLALSQGPDLKGPWSHPMGLKLGDRHDPSLFTDDNGSRYLLWQNTLIAKLKDDLTGYASEPVRIDPAGTRNGPDGTPISRIGHEGATMIKVGEKYVHLGTAWSTDQGRKGSVSLYYCVAGKITGPYGPRKFAGRFLGHGTPFQDKDGKWWCTAFFNGNVPPLDRDGIRNRDIGSDAYTINEQGVTIVPMDIRVLENGDVSVVAFDPDYAHPGPDEAQSFNTELTKT